MSSEDFPLVVFSDAFTDLSPTSTRFDTLVS